MNGRPLTAETRIGRSLDEIVEAFESHWTNESDVQRYLPGVDSSDFTAIACELIRLDLEYRWRSGEQRLVESYLPLFGSRPPTSEQLRELAFEEFRVRSQFDQPVHPEVYRRRFGVDTSGWQERSEQRNRVASRLPNEAFPNVGDQFLNFKLIGEIGQGVSGRVYLARQTDLANRIVVVKVSKSEGDEPETLARLQHTNIIPIFSRQRRRELECICMPLLGLVTLRDLFGAAPDSPVGSTGKELISTVAKRIADTVIETTSDESDSRQEDVRLALELSGSARMPALAEFDRTQTLLWMSARIADALEYAHRKGIIHGDIKPANVLVGDDGQPIVLDFHLAQTSQRAGRDFMAGGTLPYMSPEHLLALLDGRRLSPSCDIFSLGVLLYEGLTGQHPYAVLGQDDDSVRRMAEERSVNLPPLRTIARFSPATASIIEQCLLPPEKSRYQNARQVALDLECQLQDRLLRFAPNRSLRERLAKFSRRHPRLTSNVALTTIFSLLAFAVFAIINSQLQRSAGVLAGEESRNFVASLDRLVTPLTSPHSDQATAQTQREKLLDKLRSRVPPTAKQLESDPFRAEHDSVLHALYWIGNSYLHSCQAIVQPQTRADFLNDATKTINTICEKHGVSAAPLDRILNDLYAMGGEATAQTTKVSSAGRDSTPPSNDRVSRLLQIGEARTGGQDPLAIQLSDQLLADAPSDTIAWLLKGHSHLRLKEREKAELCYAMCLHLDPDSGWGQFYRGMAELEGGQFADARRDFTEYISREPSDPSGYLNRALASRGLNDPQAAIADLNAAIDLNCSQSRAYYLRSQMHARSGSPQKAKADLELFMQKDPGDELSWISRGLVFAQRNDLDAARRDFETALTINSRSRDALQNLATLDAEYSNNPLRAVELFDQLVDLDGSDSVALVTRGVLLARLGRRAESQRDAKNALQIAPGADVTYRAAGVYALTSLKFAEDRLEAIRLLRRAAQLDPQLVYSRTPTDTDLDNVRDQDEFQELMDTLKKLLDTKPDSRQVDSNNASRKK